MLIDTHAHLDMYGQHELDGILKRARENDVGTVITIGTDLPSCLITLELVDKHPDVFGAVGFHPHEARDVTADHLNQLQEWVKHPKIKAVGEIGLDYYRDYSPRKKQQAVFAAQIEIAGQLNLPIIIHNRDASADTVRILKQSGISGEKVVFHCFSGEVSLTEKLLAMGCYLSIAGPVTFANVRKTAEVVKAAPLKKMMLETDCPYLAPHPHRGQPNEPSYLPLIAEKVAEIKSFPLEEVAKTTTANARCFFSL